MASVSEQVPNTAEIGRRIPGYSIEAELGRGSTGVVYLAQELMLGRMVALKVLAPSLALEDRFRRRFTRESQAAANLEHPNVIPIYAAGESNGLLYIAMRCVDGADLRTVLEREGTFSLPRSAAILEQVAAALDAAHDECLVHRDVKPANILIDRQRGTGERTEHVYLCDFGITKHTSWGDGLTATGQFVGTIDYVAPEQIQGKPVDGRADLYALGCVAYQCLTGRAPYRRDDGTGVLWAHMNSIAPPVTTIRPDLPPAVDRIVGKAMAKEPEDRYSTCAEFIGALRALSIAPRAPEKDLHATVSLGAAPPPIAVRGHAAATRPAKRRRGPVFLGVGAAVALVLLGAGVFFFLHARFPTDAEATLLEQVPEEFTGTCVRHADAAAGAAASLHCRPGEGAEEMLLTSFGSRDALQTVYGELVSQAGVDAGTGVCRSGPAEDAYANGAQATGQVLCSLEDGSAVMRWTTEGSNILATATRSDGDHADLYTWWVTFVGPPEPFPTDEEQELLARLPETNCTRAGPEVLADFPGATAGVECPPASTGAGSVWYFQFRDRQAMHRVYDGNVQDHRPPSGVSCIAAPPGFLGEGFYMIGDDPAGRLLCYTGPDGKLMVEWTHEPTNILALAVGNSDAPAFVNWWRRFSGPATSPGPGPGPVSNPVTSAFTPQEQALLGTLPLESRVGCTSAMEDLAGIPGVTVALSCGPVAGAGNVIYLQFADQAAMQTVYDEQVRMVGVSPSGPGGPFCADLPPNFLAEHEYTIGEGPDGGRLLCYTDGDGVPVLVASHENLHLLTIAFAAGGDANSLVVWWYDTPSPS